MPGLGGDAHDGTALAHAGCQRSRGQHPACPRTRSALHRLARLLTSPLPLSPLPAPATVQQAKQPLLPSFDLAGVAQLIQGGRAKRIICMCGAGISVSAGAPAAAAAPRQSAAAAVRREMPTGQRSSLLPSAAARLTRRRRRRLLSLLRLPCPLQASPTSAAPAPASIRS